MSAKQRRPLERARLWGSNFPSYRCIESPIEPLAHHVDAGIDREGRYRRVTGPWQQVNSLTDGDLPAGYAPFNVQVLNGHLFVTYALQDQFKHDDVAGSGNGFVNVFDTSGNLIHRLISNGNLNSPWGLAIVEGELWVGNFGDGKINNYDPTTGAFLQTLMKSDGTPLQIDGLWALLPLGDGVYFTAGIVDEAHGLFGKITED